MKKKNQDVLPPIGNNANNMNDKYININKLEETQIKSIDDHNFIDNLKKENYKLFNELKKAENDLLTSNNIYERALDERNRALLSLEEELNKTKQEKQKIEQKFKQDLNEKIESISESYNRNLKKITDELENYIDKFNNVNELYHSSLDEIEKLKKDTFFLNDILNTKQKIFDQEINDLKAKNEIDINYYKKREDEFMKNSENKLETNIFQTYVDIKKKYENQLKECLLFKDKNNILIDENKIIKLSLDNNENIIQECSKIQSQQQKLIKHYTDSYEEMKIRLNKATEENKKQNEIFIEKLKKTIEEKDSEYNKLKNVLKLKNDENLQLRALSQMILDQRSEIESFFIESLEEVKSEIYKQKKENNRRRSLFPHLNQKYEDGDAGLFRVEVKDLTPSDKEKVLGLLFAKINENYKPKSYKQIDEV